jgi:mRNA interferase MazF
VRGDIYRLAAPRDVRRHEQRGVRYAVVVQSDVLALSTVLVAPTTTKSFPTTFHPRLDMDGTVVTLLVEQTTAVDPTRLGDCAGRLDASGLAAVDDALRLVLGLD